MASKTYIPFEDAGTVAGLLQTNPGWTEGDPCHDYVLRIMGGNAESLFLIIGLVVEAREMAFKDDYTTKVQSASWNRCEMMHADCYRMLVCGVSPRTYRTTLAELGHIGYVAYLVCFGLAGEQVPPDVEFSIRRYMDDDFDAVLRDRGSLEAAHYLTLLSTPYCVPPTA